MSLLYLEAEGFRNIQQLAIEPGPTVNLIYGANASGKTSLLETIYFLSHGRSFLTPKIKDIMNVNADRMHIFSKLLTDHNTVMPAGILHNRQKRLIKLNGEKINRLSELAIQLPVIALHPESHQLVSGAPKQRRQFIDWGLFHVEHSFYITWQRYQKALKQRNAALRSRQSPKVFQVWEQQITEAASVIDRQRTEYVNSLQLLLNQYQSLLFNDKEIVIDYYRGWNRDIDLAIVFEQGLKTDRERGFTHAGPHRADLRFKINGLNAETAVSRGQQKTLVVLLRLLQGLLFNQATDKNSVILFDDLPAELDSLHRQKILKMMSELPAQLFISSIEKTAVDLSLWSEQKMFHVEQGTVSEKT
ncbi:MAG: DNA replication/repair protein RecF [Gammaproteobacteria bacterium]|nr:DNA replication/repair protein RecF [Gammaproteobacteria bacterium]